MKPIAYIASPFKEKFTIPRQSGLAKSVTATITFEREFANPESIRGLENYSHIWLIFEFHATKEQGWKPLVRPPRLGGNKKMGVFATRSNFRPNSLGLSACKLLSSHYENNTLILIVAGTDLLDGTPIYDIKPYLPYVDSINEATSSFASNAPDALLSVIFDVPALTLINQEKNSFPQLQELIIEVLQQDPRPAYKKEHDDTKEYGFQLYHFDVKWRVNNHQAIVTDILQLE